MWVDGTHLPQLDVAPLEHGVEAAGDALGLRGGRALELHAPRQVAASRVVDDVETEALVKVRSRVKVRVKVRGRVRVK